jgi:hypothetical protein
MEIAPISGIRALPAVKVRQADFRPPEVFDIEASAKPGDGGGQRGGRKAAGAEESDESDFMPDRGPDEDIEDSAEVPTRQVDFFA